MKKIKRQIHRTPPEILVVRNMRKKQIQKPLFNVEEDD